MTTSRRWWLYGLSISPLLIFVGLYNLPWGTCLSATCFQSAIASSIAPLIFFLAGCLGLLGLKLFNKIYLKTSSDTTIKVASVVNKDFEMLTFLMTYVLPLIAFGQNLANNNVKESVFFSIITFGLGVLYIRTELYMSNPVLLYYNLKLLHLTNDKDEEILVLSRDEISVGDFVQIRYLGAKTAIAAQV